MTTARRAIRDKVADFFRAYPNSWLTANDLQVVGGLCAWRTRVSDCRRQLGMVIENRLSKTDSGVLSEYRYVPAAAE